MINLLPQSEKGELLHGRWLRLGIILCCLLLTLEVVGVVFLTPAYYALYLSTNDLTQSLAQLQALAPKNAKGAEESLATIKKAMALLEPSSGIVDVPPSFLLQEITKQKPEGVDLFAFSYVRTANAASIQLSGVAATQEDLLAFRRNVQANPRVQDLKYGSSFIIRKSDIDFTATVTFK